MNANAENKRKTVPIKKEMLIQSIRDKFAPNLITIHKNTIRTKEASFLIN
jgi:hypothetical protein